MVKTKQLQRRITRARRVSQKILLVNVPLVDFETNPEPSMKKNNTRSHGVPCCQSDTTNCDDSSTSTPHLDELISNMYWKQ